VEVVDVEELVEEVNILDVVEEIELDELVEGAVELDDDVLRTDEEEDEEVVDWEVLVVRLEVVEVVTVAKYSPTPATIKIMTIITTTIALETAPRSLLPLIEGLRL